MTRKGNRIVASAEQKEIHFKHIQDDGISEKFKKEVYSGPMGDVVGPLRIEGLLEPNTQKCYTIDTFTNITTCRICKKRYKTENRILKHLWEHHPFWQGLNNVLNTKHKKVRLLETAQYLTLISFSLNHRNKISESYEETM
eukprot:GHVP01000222.1.p1 GENE.GHVP01000222.1~~GHVP01000222.1.p1  ORF type:complete len:141 (+),score=26.15 GHVP01000222.1:2-424(+)